MSAHTGRVVTLRPGRERPWWGVAGL